MTTKMTAVQATLDTGRTMAMTMAMAIMPDLAEAGDLHLDAPPRLRRSTRP